PVYRQLSPNTGTYMNETDWGDPCFKQDFYSSNKETLSDIKTKYDLNGVFYCQICVRSDQWKADESGAICRRDD
ncbi:hypothetical protein LX36DRAFT_587331, partial [Colletotrichum falcatum]